MDTGVFLYKVTIIFIYGTALAISLIFMLTINTFIRLSSALNIEFFEHRFIDPLERNINIIEEFLIFCHGPSGAVFAGLALFDLIELLRIADAFPFL